VIGPVAGSLETPSAFQSECESAPWYTKLRRLDGFRLRFDPWLRHSYQSADVVIGVAPYVADLLKPIPIRWFELASETGVHDVPDPSAGKSPSRDALQLLYVGRVIRSKGLRDVVRSMGMLRDLPGIHLHAAGDGEDLPACREEARSLGVGDRITFLGRVPRDHVESLYRQCDAFVFPSFREPSGNVVFEAMRWGLPVITTNRGGPAFVVDDHSGIRLAADTPSQLAADLAATIRRLAGDPQSLRRLSQGARERIADVGLWSHKIDRMLKLYRRVVANAKRRPSPVWKAGTP
jgi:glycosyltransferase involved in cell wall biosynthesis